jgi:hypothetical protein
MREANPRTTLGEQSSCSQGPPWDLNIKRVCILSLVVGFHKFNPTYWLKRFLFFVSFVVKTTGLEKGLKNIPITGHKSPSRPYS